jgi:cytochrome c biogenesis factor
LREGGPRSTMWGATLWLALAATVLLLWRPHLHQRHKAASFGLHLLLAVPFFTLAGLFLTNTTSVLHVAAFGGEALPLKYRFAATWAAREGPLLMWLGWMALLAWWWREALPGEVNAGPAHTLRLRAVHSMHLTLVLVAFSLDPFKTTPPFFQGAGLNPLLQTDLMVIHPPLIFLAYSMCLHMTATGLAASGSMNTDHIGPRLLKQARPAFLVATLGIGLGGLWAYLILDWGGYWAWDPVETGSFLPWLALAMLVHLRTRPGRTPDHVWIGGAVLTGVLSLFATTVTRAGGVWASSIHTFVTDDGGTPPSDVFGRLMELRTNAASTEVMTYVVWMSVLLGSWWALVHRARRGGEASAGTLVWLGFPWAAALLGWMWLGNDNMAGSWAMIPGVAFLLPLLVPLLVDARSLKTQPTARSEEHPAWSYATLTPLPLHLLLPLLLFAVTRDPIIAVVFGLLFHPLYVAPSALNAWPWTAAGVMLGLAMAWSMLLTLPVAGGVVLAFVLPWLLAGDTDSPAMKWSERRTHTRMALWGSVILASLYLVLTWVLLLASIDAVNFEAHELYGAPFLAAVAVCFILYTRRHDDAKHTAAVLAAALLITVVGMTLFATNLGADSATLVSGGPLTRGHLAWASLPTLTIALPLMVRETMDQIKKAGKKAPWKRIPVGAHIVHVGLLVLLLGHLSTTVLVDRGDASHRLTLIRDETVVHRGYGFEFTDLTLTDDDLEVGDGFVGVTIVVHEVKDDGTKEEIGTVHPGTLRFDRQGVARSEVDTLSGLTGDLVFIFDGSQSAALMQRVVSESTDAVDTVRITVYVLPHSHAVWLGWVTMMFGMATITVAGFQNADSPASKPPNEEE